MGAYREQDCVLETPSAMALVASCSVKPKIVFLVMSAVNKASAVDQLANALAPHTVLVHHDFSQTPEFELNEPNILFVPDAKRTGWANFGFVDGIFHALRYALEHLDFDYLQLLSPTCLPIKPIGEFEVHVSGDAEAHFESVDLLEDVDALMSVGYRAFTPAHSLRHRMLRRVSAMYFGASPGRRDLAGVWLRSGFATRRNGKMTLVAKAALTVVKALSHPALGRHIFDNSLRPFYGSTWFGAQRGVVATMVEHFLRPGIRDYFSRLWIADEFLIPTLLMHSGARSGPTNHYVHTFDEAHPGWIEVADLDLLRASPAFFGRKFVDDPTAVVRRRVLRELVKVAERSSIADERRLNTGSVAR